MVQLSNRRTHLHPVQCAEDDGLCAGGRHHESFPALQDAHRLPCDGRQHAVVVVLPVVAVHVPAAVVPGNVAGYAHRCRGHVGGEQLQGTQWFVSDHWHSIEKRVRYPIPTEPLNLLYIMCTAYAGNVASYKQTSLI